MQEIRIYGTIRATSDGVMILNAEERIRITQQISTDVGVDGNNQGFSGYQEARPFTYLKVQTGTLQTATLAFFNGLLCDAQRRYRN